MTALLATALTPILKVLGKAAGKLAHRLHKEEFHRYAEECKKRDVAAGYDHFKIESNANKEAGVLSVLPEPAGAGKAKDINRTTIANLLSVLILYVVLTCSGCASITHAWRIGFVHAHEAIDEVVNEQQTAP